MFNNNINHDFINRFLRRLLPARKDKLKKIEEYAAAHDIPICSPEVGNFLQTLISSSKSSSILEIGTAIGYSTLHMAQAKRGIKITTIEKNEELIAIARNLA